MNAKPKSRKRPYGPFALAAGAYVCGVVAFSLWSYQQQKNGLMGQAGRLLTNAAYAADELIGKDYAAQLTAQDLSGTETYAACQKKLNRLAKKSGLTGLGQAVKQSGETYALVYGHGSSGTVITEIRYRTPLSPGLRSMVLELAGQRAQAETVQSYDHPEFGRLLAFVQYRPVGGDSGQVLFAIQDAGRLNKLLLAAAVQKSVAGVFLLVMIFPLVALYNRTKGKAAKKLAKLNALLQYDVETRKHREHELKDAIADLERFNAVAVGREDRIIQLKGEVNTLLEQLKQEKRYNVDHIE
ncbi:hypothetical protein [Pontiella sulfatireligans]|uniref:Uncharacterized protein n=1 Tax=Pontiella sulfatireligans TaxID=2750658 RepID=A0A6C2US05_9BACT|nr:hypothetical protein [Pontiella sulfatireligans]VGO22007.1 hypothetical protein SCARR_04088 [Pontiella sulfatireligans]